jgi:hypothetical protein
MTKPITTQLEENGQLIDIKLDVYFLEFYKKETGHSHITKRGVTRFLKHLLQIYNNRIKTYSSC